jgi:putative SOS response-associated peptidase YedK
MVMTEACIHVADVHDRMPVILQREDWADWLDGAPDAAGLLCRPHPNLMVKERNLRSVGEAVCNKLMIGCKKR